MLRRGATYVTSAILPIRNVDLTSLPIARIVLILKVELFFADYNVVMNRIASRLRLFQYDFMQLLIARLLCPRRGHPRCDQPAAIIYMGR